MKERIHVKLVMGIDANQEQLRQDVQRVEDPDQQYIDKAQL